MHEDDTLFERLDAHESEPIEFRAFSGETVAEALRAVADFIDRWPAEDFFVYALTHEMHPDKPDAHVVGLAFVVSGNRKD